MTNSRLYATSRLLSCSAEDEGTLTHEQVAALANNPQLVGLLQGLAMMAGVKGEGEGWE